MSFFFVLLPHFLQLCYLDLQQQLLYCRSYLQYSPNLFLNPGVRHSSLLSKFYPTALTFPSSFLLLLPPSSIRQTEAKYGHIADLSYSGFNSFAHLPHTHEGCLRTPGQNFDLAVVGAPYDGGVSFRTGARFG